ncbi:MAG: hydrogenase iron-sulfur subunit [Desulfobacterales bacterium]|nr:hydrogenase iron-sulfur subunit [Desulfobacterales bacterium]
MSPQYKPKVTLFYCINSIDKETLKLIHAKVSVELTTVEMACSSMTKDVYLLRAFESGADKVVVVACPETQCRYVQGSIRARKRVEYVKKILNEIGLDCGRLSMLNATARDKETVVKFFEDIGNYKLLKN